MTTVYLDLDAPDCPWNGWDEFDVRAARVTMVEPRNELVHALQAFFIELGLWAKWPQWYLDELREREDA